MKIQFYTKNVYGNQLIYPTGQHAAALMNLTGRKTITELDLRTLNSMGITVEQVEDPAATIKINQK